MFKIIRFVEKYIVMIVLVVLFLGVSMVNAISPEAPVIVKANVVVNGNVRTFIVEGTATEETEILVYVNNEYFGTTKVLNDKFVFSEKLILSRKVFNVVSAARNSATQEISELSNVVIPVETIKIKTPAQKPKETEETKTVQAVKEKEVEEVKTVEEPQKSGEISPEAAQEEQPAVKGHEDEYVENSSEEISEEETLETLKNILSGNEEKTSTASTGIINEAREELGKIKLNVFIFLIFLVAVIAWIVWVNRELIKEKQEEKN